MKEWVVDISTPGLLTSFVFVVEAENAWQAILAAGRAGQIPLDVQSIRVEPAS